MRIHNRKVLMASVLAWLCAMPMFAPAAFASPSITVGSLTLTFCNVQYHGYCGTLSRPLNPRDAASGTINIGFEYYPRHRADLPSLGTFLPQEGGPGYSSTGTRDAYLSLFGSLRERRDVLIIDKRGTGSSGALDCPALQAGSLTARAAIAACARQLGASAWYYGSAQAAADVIAILDALQIEQVDYYGDSYGTFFGQVLAVRYPSRVRSIVLDSAYPVQVPDLWFPTDWATAWRGYDLACARWQPCAAQGIAPSEHIRAVLQYVRQQPLVGWGTDADGVPRRVKLDAPTLFATLDYAGSSPTFYRDMDAAARAWLEQGDASPLLRLTAEAQTGGATPPDAFSAALYTAVACQEYPLLYKLRSSIADRAADYLAGIAQARAQRPALFYPFTIDEQLQSQVDITPLDTCLDWPAPAPGYYEEDALPPNPQYPSIPTLILSGDLDAVTSPVDAADVAQRFPMATHLLVPNLTHITAFSDEDNLVVPGGGDLTFCVSGVVRRFIESRKVLDIGCIAGVRPIRTVDQFATLAAQLAPPTADPGNQGSTLELQVAAAAAETVGDTTARFFVNFTNFNRGLRGGHYTMVRTASGYLFTLTSLQWTTDVTVSGTIDWDMATDTVRAQLQVICDCGVQGNVSMSWQDNDPAAVVSMTGTLDGHAIRAHRYAP